MLGQVTIMPDGSVLDKVQLAIRRLKTFEPPDGYYVAFSGGKDSQCIYHLCEMAGVKFDAHYAVTSVDPPELVQFIKERYPDVQFERQYYSDGKPEHYYADGRPRPITMWSLIADHTIPPTRKARYCCQSLKEPGGGGRVVVTGVRWAESANRKETHDVVSLRGKPKKTKQLADDIGVDYKVNKHGAIILNDDNDEARRMVEQCYRTRKTMVNPIVDWSEDEVWEFLNTYNIPHCSLYDEGFTRLGCIGCPLAGSKNMRRDFERWPKYREMYVRAFQKMIDNHPGEIRIFERKAEEERAELGGGGYRLQGVAGFSVVTEGSVMKAQTGDFNDAKTENPSTETGLIWEPVEPDGERLMKRHEWINGVLSGDETPPQSYSCATRNSWTGAKQTALQRNTGVGSAVGEFVLEWYIHNLNG